MCSQHHLQIMFWVKKKGCLVCLLTCIISAATKMTASHMFVVDTLTQITKIYEPIFINGGADVMML